MLVVQVMVSFTSQRLTHLNVISTLGMRWERTLKILWSPVRATQSFGIFDGAVTIFANNDATVRETSEARGRPIPNQFKICSLCTEAEYYYFRSNVVTIHKLNDDAISPGLDQFFIGKQPPVLAQTCSCNYKSLLFQQSVSNLGYYYYLRSPMFVMLSTTLNWLALQ